MCGGNSTLLFLLQMGSFWGVTEGATANFAESKTFDIFVEAHGENIVKFNPMEPVETVRMHDGEVWQKGTFRVKIDQVSVWRRIE